jgi:hypothetical protein
MPQEMQGKRVQQLPENPGEYYGPVVDPKWAGGKPVVFYLKPNSRDPGVPKIARCIHHCISPPHVFIEEPDGSLTIRNSLGENRGSDGVGDGWHGWLTEGRFELNPSK